MKVEGGNGKLSEIMKFSKFESRSIYTKPK